ncbi:hypothetical protein IV203_013280 [Nitzschia inconspicua]|uniref:RING-type domain-containing protein n=1 Tax=Nitzschia inconspicua TaxID=303405 RepID=A0A9K3Q8P2_9STRA|nr:hypothetical protein IV203_013280 [Nitzschia inconspicua]
MEDGTDQDPVGTIANESFRTAEASSTSSTAQNEVPQDGPGTATPLENNDVTTGSSEASGAVNSTEHDGPAPTLGTSEGGTTASTNQPPQRVSIRLHNNNSALPVPQIGHASPNVVPTHVAQPWISAAQFGNQVRLNLGGGNVVTVPLHVNDRPGSDGIPTGLLRHGNINIRVVQTDPLVPQPMEDTGTTTFTRNGTAGEIAGSNIEQQQHQQHFDDPELSRFKCDICYDFLKVIPVGCGKCSARFCQECLDRVYQDESRRRMPHKCPMCRVEYELIVKDEALHHEMDTGPTLPCRFEGCPARHLPLSMIVEHEKVCEYVPMRCRYAFYGCSWTGKRGMIQEHEKSDCRVAPVGPFVEQFRQSKAETNARLDIVGQQIVGISRMQGSIRQEMVRDQWMSTCDSFQILHYCHCLTCATPVALLQKDKWRTFWSRDEARASVVNFLVFLPFLVPPITIGAQGLSSFCLCMDKVLISGTKLLKDDSNSTISLDHALFSLLTPQIERLVEIALIGFCTAMFGALSVALNFTDEKSSKDWRGIKLGQLGTPPIIGDMLGICIFALFMCVIEYHDGGIRALVTWTLVLFSSTFFPSLVLTLSHFMAGKDPPSPSDIPSMARSIGPLMLGLRYSLLEAFFGLPACLDAAIIVALIPRPIATKFLDDCFVGQLPEVARVAFLGFKLALWGSQAYNQFFQDGSMYEVLSTIADSVFAAFTLCLTNEMVHGLFTYGVKVGSLVATHSRRHVRPEGVVKDFSILGIVAFGTWCAAIFAISQM